MIGTYVYVDGEAILDPNRHPFKMELNLGLKAQYILKPVKGILYPYYSRSGANDQLVKWTKKREDEMDAEVSLF